MKKILFLIALFVLVSCEKPQPDEKFDPASFVGTWVSPSSNNSTGELTIDNGPVVIRLRRVPDPGFIGLQEYDAKESNYSNEKLTFKLTYLSGSTVSYELSFKSKTQILMKSTSGVYTEEIYTKKL